MNVYMFKVLSHVCLLLVSASPLVPLINGDFENDQGWIYDEQDHNGWISFMYSTTWSTHGSRSGLFHVPGDSPCSHYVLAGDWCRIRQNVDLTDFSTMKFDLKTERMEALGLGSEYWSRALVKIDEDIVWSTTESNQTFLDIAIDISSYSGGHMLSIEWYFNATWCAQGLRGFYIDNVRLEGPNYVCGDMNGDELIDLMDPVYLINTIFMDGQLPYTMEAADTNGDGKVNIADVVYLLNYLFEEGPSPIC